MGRLSTDSLTQAPRPLSPVQALTSLCSPSGTQTLLPPSSDPRWDLAVPGSKSQRQKSPGVWDDKHGQVGGASWRCPRLWSEVVRRSGRHLRWRKTALSVLTTGRTPKQRKPTQPRVHRCLPPATGQAAIPEVSWWEGRGAGLGADKGSGLAPAGRPHEHVLFFWDHWRGAVVSLTLGVPESSS